MIRMSQWAEIRQMHVVDGVPKKQIAERLGLDIKTVRRAVAQAAAPARRAVSRPRHLDRWRAQIEQWLRQDRRLTAKRIRRLLLPLAGPVAERTVRWYVARLKAAAAPKEVYVHRSPRPGVTLEVDFGESWAEVAGVLRQVKYVVATLPYSNVYFAKAYPVERLESLLDGIQAAFAYMGGVTDRVVLDNTTIAVKQVLTGRDRVQTDAFQAFRGAYPFAAAFCAPAKGWEKGSVETGVTYVRNLVFRPRPTVASWAALNALIITELEADVATRRLADGRPVREAWTLERRHLRAVPVHLPETCRVEARVVDKFGHGRADRVTYSVPTRYAYRPAPFSTDLPGETVVVDTQLRSSGPRKGRPQFSTCDQHWHRAAAERYPHGLPKPSSSDPTQWLFDGQPGGSDGPLQVAVAWLLGYQWPRQTGSRFPDCPVLGADGLEKIQDGDGIVCIPAVRGERPAHERLLKVLQTVWVDNWDDAILASLLSDGGSSNLDDWLRNGFFEQHCKLFHDRPFIWHIWDGRKRDGFHALVNSHKLAEGDGKGRRLLDWYRRDREGRGSWSDRSRRSSNGGCAACVVTVSVACER